MTLEELVFDLGNGGKIELKPELLVQEVDPYLGTIPAVITFDGGSMDVSVNYDIKERAFLPGFVDEYSEEDRELSLSMARTYSACLGQGHVQVIEYDFLKDERGMVYGTIHDYRLHLASLEKSIK